jgi:uncharacterized protein (TIGR03435 family)
VRRLVTGGVLLLASVVVGALAVPRVHGQAREASHQETPAFEVTSVKPNTSGDGRARGIGSPPGGRFMMTDVPLRAIIRFAYDIQNSQLSGGPSWLDSEFYDIAAKAASEQVNANGQVPPDTMRTMVRALLVDRFKLSAHRETRELPIYALVVARSDRRLGPQLRPSAVDCDAFAQRGERPPLPPAGGAPACGGQLGAGHLALNGFTMSRLAVNLSTWVDRPVSDRTGLSGGFNFTLEWSLDQRPQYDAIGGPARPVEIPVDRTGPSIFTAVEEQLGLKLESTKGPVDVLVIDHVEKPTPD